ncbi:MAG: extracellular solute-binding protein [Oscillospiraceae bacterium]|jgi:ABC-type glycerol-3-phosphate transport system substrate-binding protein/outer membrane protein assembly factor BamB|nr:extracellular solute-binding protein [Oscillospiraceae bacterium]
MKKHSILIVILFVIILSGCSSNSGDEQPSVVDPIQTTNRSPEDIYIADIIPFPSLPDGMQRVGFIELAENEIYFTTWGDGGEYTTSDVHGLFTMSYDGTGFNKLSNYTPGSLPLDAINGYTSITSIHIDNDGYIWVSEFRGLQDSDIADGLSKNILRKLDNTGTELSIFDLGSLAEISESFYVYSLCVDNAGNIYISSENNLYILDNKGNLLFNLSNPDHIGYFIRLSDGTVAFPEVAIEQDRNIYLKKIDIERKSWGEIIRLPSNVPNVQNIYSGVGEYLSLYNDNSYLNSIVAETGEHIKVLSWVDSYLSAEDITGVMFLSDGNIAATRQAWYTSTGSRPVPELILLTEASTVPKLPDSDHPDTDHSEDSIEKKQLVFATFNWDSSRRYAVELFNSKNKTHSIEVIDYSRFNTDDDWTAGLVRLTTEMISGNYPDILDIWNMPTQSYISHGLLVDLYPLLDADPELGRNSLIDSLLSASEVNGFLYRLIPTFSIETIIGHPSVLGSYPGWNIDEFISVLEANPQADLPLGTHNDKMMFFSLVVRNNIDKYVDRVSNTASFDSDEFIGILKLANTFPAEPDLDNRESPHRLIAAGRQIMDMGWFGDVTDYPLYRAWFGDDLVFKGFPMEGKDGNAFGPLSSIAITKGCTDLEAAWEFIRIFITEDYQRDMLNRTFPVNRVVFDERLNKVMTSSAEWDIGNGLIIKNTAISQVEADRLMNLINNITRIRDDDNNLWTIIREGAADYFNDRGTAEDIARVIQNRASIYLSEQAG